MFRFFVSQKVNNHFILDKATLEHIKVARVTNKPFICIYQGNFYVTKLNHNVAEIKTILKENHEFNAPVVVCLSVINLKRFEWAIQKAAELGATHFIPIMSQNVQLDKQQLKHKLNRWQMISQNASEQSFRNFVMQVLPFKDFKEVMDLKLPELEIRHKYIAHEKVTTTPLSSFPTNSLFLIGPEGGFSDTEISLATANHFQPISLGKRILRAETSAIFLISRVQDS